MALTRMPRPGEKVTFPTGRYAGVALVVDHVDAHDLVWCIYPGTKPCVMPFIGRFASDGAFNTEAEIIEESTT